MRKTIVRRLLIVSGTISTGLGIIGIFMPVLPTTPFLLLAAACYMRSSDRFYRWLLNNRLFGAYIKGYIEGKGIALKIKILTTLLLWATTGVTVTFSFQHIVLRIVLISIAIGVTLHISLIRPKRVKNI